MSFTVTLSGPASGSSGQLSTTGTFTASITGNDDGSVSGTWSFSGTYQDSSFYGTSGSESVSGTLSGTGSPSGPWTVSLTGANITANNLALSYANGQYSLGLSGSYPIDYQVNLGYDGNYTYHDVFAFAAQLAGSGPPPGGGGTPFNDTLVIGAGSNTVDGGDGIDTAVFSDVRANYTLTQTPGTSTWTVMHNVTGGDTTTLENVERLTFSDEKVAVDNGMFDHGGEAYRLYQAAFNRVPDIGGLGFQINALDSGLSLEQVAGNFIASPEFQATYGAAIDDTTFLTLLYQNVLHRAPDSGGLQYHLNEMNVLGQTRIDELIHFSQSPENQANVAGAISSGMVFVFS